MGLVIILIGLIIYFVLRKNSSYGNFHNMIFALGIVNVFIGMVMYIDYSAYINDVTALSLKKSKYRLLLYILFLTCARGYIAGLLRLMI